MDPREENSPHSKVFLYYLMATALICGAMVMVIEVLGSKVIGPVFGVSIFVWTSLIAVTLVALSAGYAVGGAYSDIKKSPDNLYVIIFLSGILAMLVPLIKGPVLRYCQPLGLRSGSLASSTMLFGPSLFLLGFVSPYIVKIAARELRNIGRTVGLFYAISTVGSVLGTVLTGFYLLAYFGVNWIFWSVGLALICLSLGYFLFFRKKFLLLALLAVTLFLLPGEPVKSKDLGGGFRLTELHSMDSFYGSLKVLESTNVEDETRRYRVMLLDGIMQGAIDYNSGLSLLDYPYLLQFLPYSINPEGRNALVIGLGAGVIPRWYSSMGVSTDVVDISPDVVKAAKDYFRFESSGEVHVTDARFFLENIDRQYDYIILDVFLGEMTPAHVFSAEAFTLMKKRLSDGGVLALNLLGTLERGTIVIDSVIHTIKAVFPTVDIYRLYSAAEDEPAGNIVVVAYDFSPVTFDPGLFARHEIHPLARVRIERLKGKYETSLNPDALVLSDEFNPADYMDLKLKEQLREHFFDRSFLDFIT